MTSLRLFGFFVFMFPWAEMTSRHNVLEFRSSLLTTIICRAVFEKSHNCHLSDTRHTRRLRRLRSALVHTIFDPSLCSLFHYVPALCRLYPIQHIIVGTIQQRVILKTTLCSFFTPTYKYRCYDYAAPSSIMLPNPATLMKGGNKDIPEPSGPMLGTITLDELHTYDCNNPNRRIFSLFGTLFDVTTSEKGYGKNGACEFDSFVLLLCYYYLNGSLVCWVLSFCHRSVSHCCLVDETKSGVGASHCCVCCMHPHKNPFSSWDFTLVNNHHAYAYNAHFLCTLTPHTLFLPVFSQTRNMPVETLHWQLVS